MEVECDFLVGCCRCVLRRRVYHNNFFCLLFFFFSLVLLKPTLTSTHIHNNSHIFIYGGDFGTRTQKRLFGPQSYRRLHYTYTNTHLRCTNTFECVIHIARYSHSIPSASKFSYGVEWMASNIYYIGIWTPSYRCVWFTYTHVWVYCVCVLCETIDVMRERERERHTP